MYRNIIVLSHDDIVVRYKIMHAKIWHKNTDVHDSKRTRNWRSFFWCGTGHRRMLYNFLRATEIPQTQQDLIGTKADFNYPKVLNNFAAGIHEIRYMLF